MNDKKPGPRKRILTKAIELFYIQGLRNTGINQIIAESDVAKASFYQHFPSKGDLIRECIRSYDKYIKRKIVEIGNSGNSFHDVLMEWILVMKSELEVRKGFQGCPAAEAAFQTDSSDIETFNQIKEIVNGWTIMVSGYIENMKKNGKLSVRTDSLILAKRFIFIYEGALTMWKLSGDMKYIEDLEFFVMNLVNMDSL